MSVYISYTKLTTEELYRFLVEVGEYAAARGIDPRYAADEAFSVHKEKLWDLKEIEE